MKDFFEALGRGAAFWLGVKGLGSELLGDEVKGLGSELLGDASPRHRGEQKWLQGGLRGRVGTGWCA